LHWAHNHNIGSQFAGLKLLPRWSAMHKMSQLSRRLQFSWAASG
jgi:hypothetical protein